MLDSLIELLKIQEANKEAIRILDADDQQIERSLSVVKEIKEMSPENRAEMRRFARDKLNDLQMESEVLRISVVEEPVVPIQIGILIASLCLEKEKCVLMVCSVVYGISIHVNGYCRSAHKDADSKLLEMTEYKIWSLWPDELNIFQRDKIRQLLSNRSARVWLQVSYVLHNVHTLSIMYIHLEIKIVFWTNRMSFQFLSSK